MFQCNFFTICHDSFHIDEVRSFVHYDYRMFLTWPLPGDFAVNYGVCLMTRIQKMSLDYHFKVEQESGSFVHSFFGFNGKSWFTAMH
jgi:hypothetical protein